MKKPIRVHADTKQKAKTKRASILRPECRSNYQLYQVFRTCPTHASNRLNGCVSLVDSINLAFAEMRFRTLPSYMFANTISNIFQDQMLAKYIFENLQTKLSQIRFRNIRNYMLAHKIGLTMLANTVWQSSISTTPTKKMSSFIGEGTSLEVVPLCHCIRSLAPWPSLTQ